MLGPMLGVDAGSTEIDGFMEGLLDGKRLEPPLIATITVRPSVQS